MPILDRVSAEDALTRVREALPDALLRARLNFGQVDVACEPAHFLEVMSALRDDPRLSCKFFTFLSGVDRSEAGGEQQAGGLEVLVHVYSPDHGFHVNVHVPVDSDNPVCRSITSLFEGANWHERETAEMFGIEFEGHPRLVKLYLPEDFEGYPLRKSFRLPSRLVKDWPGAKDPEEAAAGGRG